MCSEKNPKHVLEQQSIRRVIRAHRGGVHTYRRYSGYMPCLYSAVNGYYYCYLLSVCTRLYYHNHRHEELGTGTTTAAMCCLYVVGCTITIIVMKRIPPRSLQASCAVIARYLCRLDCSECCLSLRIFVFPFVSAADM